MRRSNNKAYVIIAVYTLTFIYLASQSIQVCKYNTISIWLLHKRKDKRELRVVMILINIIESKDGSKKGLFPSIW